QVEAVDLTAWGRRLGSCDLRWPETGNFGPSVPKPDNSLVDGGDEQPNAEVGLPCPGLPSIPSSRGERLGVEVFVGDDAAVGHAPAVDVCRGKPIGIVE